MSYCDNLKKYHPEAMLLYGTGNDKRMTGLHETAKFDEFTYGVGARGCSGVSALADVTINNGEFIKELVQAYTSFRKSIQFFYME